MSLTGGQFISQFGWLTLTTIGNMSFLLKFFFLILPIQTGLIWRVVFVAGSQWQSATLMWFFTEIFLYILLLYWRAEDSWLAAGTVGRIVAALGLGFLLIKNQIQSKKIIFWLSLGAVVSALIGVVQFFLQTTWSSTILGLAKHPGWISGSSVVVTATARWLRAYGTFAHPNVFGGFLVMVIAYVMLWLRRSEIKSTAERLWYGTVLIFLTAGLVFSFSRSAWLAFIILLGCSCYFIFKKNIRSDFFSLSVLISILTFLILIGLVWPIALTRASFASSNEIVSVTERLSGYSAAFSIFSDHWFLGIGPGNYTVELHKKNPGLAGWQLQPVHNVWLIFLIEWGGLGLGLVFLLLKIFLPKNFFKNKEFIVMTAVLLPLLFLDHYLYTTWVGLIMSVIMISSTVYPQDG